MVKRTEIGGGRIGRRALAGLLAPVLLYGLSSICGSCGLCGCRRGRGEEAKAQYVQALCALRAGSLARAYAAVLPPSHDRDLNDLLSRAMDLVSEDEFRLFKETAAKAGRKLSPLLAAMASRSAALGVLSAKVKDLPAALGLESFEELRKRGVRGLLEAIDRGLFDEVARAEDVKARLDAVEVSVAEEKGDWARLRFVARDSGGAASEDSIEVLNVDGKWVPAAWAVDWQPILGELRSRIAAAREAKDRDPEALKKQLQSLDKLLENPAPLLEMVLARFAEAFGKRG